MQNYLQLIWQTSSMASFFLSFLKKKKLFFIAAFEIAEGSEALVQTSDIHRVPKAATKDCLPTYPQRVKIHVTCKEIKQGVVWNSRCFAEFRRAIFSP